MFIAFSQYSFSQNWVESQIYTGNNIGFGQSTSISGEYMVTGFAMDYFDAFGSDSIYRAGAAYIFKKDSNNNWVQHQKIVASDRAIDDGFGSSVAIAGNYLVISSPSNNLDDIGNNNLNNSGAAYIFEKDSNDNWVQKQKIVAFDRKTGDGLGVSVSIYGDYIIVGAPYQGFDETGGGIQYNACGAVYIFKRNAIGNWLTVQKIVPSDRMYDMMFGANVSIIENKILVGATAEDNDVNGVNTLFDAGAAYIFESDSFGIWTQKQKIVPTDRLAKDRFGNSVSIYGNYAIVGAYTKQFSQLNDEVGAAYIFERNPTGNWIEKQKLITPDKSYNENYGYSVYISDDYAVVGAWGNDYNEFGVDSIFNSGAAFVYKKNSANEWIESQKLVASDRKNYSNNSFGGYVCIDDKTIAIGATKLYIFSNKGVSGNVFLDSDENCNRNYSEIGIKHKKATILPNNIIVETNIVGNWLINSLPVGNYTITVDTSGNWQPTCSTTQNFTVVNLDSITIAPNFGFISTQPCAAPSVSVNMPFMRPCFTNQAIYVQACNTNLATGVLTSAYVELELDSLLIPTSSSIPYTSLGNNTYRFDVGTLNPGQCVNFTVNTTVSCSAVLGQTLCMQANLYPADSCVFDQTPTPPVGGVEPCTLPWDNSSLSVDGWCQNDTVYFSVTNTGSAANGNMQCYSPIRVYVDGVLTTIDSVLLAGGQTVIFSYFGNGQTWTLQADQHPLHPGNSHPNASVEACGDSLNWTPGLINTLSLDDADPMVDIYCGVVTGSYDPNDKTGYPLGVGNDHFVAPNGKIDYVIRFQNTGTDTAFTVVVRDTLDVDLDIFSVQSGVSSHNYTFRMFGPRVLEWTFNNILLPDSATDEPASNGFVTFTVNQNPNLPDGTVINNRVGIYFDFNAPVITNTTTHTINRGINYLLTINQSKKSTNNSLYIYPNPTKNLLNIVVSDALSLKIDIYGIDGKLIEHKTITKNTAIDVSKYQSGLYFINATTNKGEVFRNKFVKE